MKKPLENFLKTVPKKVIFCKRCVVSNQRPRISFDSRGICGACNYADLKKNFINWKKREKELIKLCNQLRKKDGSWDVLIPGSGGKDSAFTAHILKNKYGLNPLCVTWAPFKYTNIGFKNFENFAETGFLTINAFGNGKLNKVLSRLCFEEIGDNFTPFAMGQHGFVYHIAKAFNIKAVFYGEPAETEYGGETKTQISQKGAQSLKENAKLFWKGNTIRDLIKFGKKNKKYFKKIKINDPDFSFYEPPKNLSNDIKMYFLGYFLHWKPQENYYYASEFTNFKPNPERSEGTYSKYASLDDQLDGLHYYLMLIKFGIGRATSDAAHEIRDGLISRQDGINLVEKYDTEFPIKYFNETLDFLGISKNDFNKTIDSFRQKHIWKKVNGKWKLRHTVGKTGTDD